MLIGIVNTYGWWPSILSIRLPFRITSLVISRLIAKTEIEELADSGHENPRWIHPQNQETAYEEALMAILTISSNTLPESSPANPAKRSSIPMKA